MGGDSDARRRLGVEAEAPATTAAPLHEAIRAAAKALWQSPAIDTSSAAACNDAASTAVEAAAPILLADLEAVENERDHAQNVARAAREQIAAQEAMLADHGSGATTQHHWKRAALNKLRDLKALRDQHATLEAHTAELHDLLDRAGFYVATWGGPEADALADKIRAALAAPPPQRGRELLRFGVGNGNCFAACIASLLDLRLDQVPDVMAADDWWEQLCGWARGLGWNLLSLDDPRAGSWDELGYWIAGGPCERGGRHSCVYRDGQLAHDPHPSRAGLLAVDTWTLLVPLDPGVWHR